MPSGTESEQIALVVRLAIDEQNAWHLHVDGTHGTDTWPLVPLMLIVRMHRYNSVLRGTLRLNDNTPIPIQIHTDIIALLQSWVGGGAMGS